MDDLQRYYPPGSGMGELRLAHAYVPFQRFKESYPLNEALMKGTLYPELYMPYRPDRPRGYF